MRVAAASLTCTRSLLAAVSLSMRWACCAKCTPCSSRSRAKADFSAPVKQG